MSGIVGTSHSKSKVIGSSKDIAKAWALYEQSGGTLIDSSFNISGIADNGTGLATLTFSKAFSSGNKVCATVSCRFGGVSSLFSHHTTTSLQVRTSVAGSNMTASDYDTVGVIVFGDQ